MRSALLILVICVATLSSGCMRAGYYLQSARGQLDLMSRRVDIEKLIEKPETPDDLREQLRLVQQIREFASDELGLPDNRSYRSYADLERPYAVWNVFAAEEFSVQPETWCFPIVGCVAYRGYFKESSAWDYADKLAADGFDVHVAGIAAYSTLGQVADPVLNTMLAGDELYLAGLIFHELSHQLFYVQDESVFNESFAMLVEEEGVRRWLAQQDNEQAWAGWMTRRERVEQFSELVIGTRDELAALYQQDLPDELKRSEKNRIILQLRAAHEQLQQAWGGYSGYERWFAGPLNNAQLSSVATYRLATELSCA
ncbi:MAG: aminopeptidase, partial [Gammaproteobacteria bacterium]|nr:aminopeptidase [Gammaproteobacteria bacterium]